MGTYLAGVVVLDRADLLEVARLVRVAERYRMNNGLPAASVETATLKQLVNEALADERTAHGPQNKTSRHHWVTTSEYAHRVGCSARTARRHATLHGRRQGGRWLIPIRDEQE